MKKPEFPFVVRKGSVTVKIYFTPSHGSDSYTVVYWQDGVRKRPTYSTFKEAKEDAELIAIKLASSDADVLTLKSADRAAYLRAKELLAEVNVPIELASAQFASAKKALGETPLSTAVEFYLKRHPVNSKPRLVKEVVDELLDVRRQDGVSDGYLKHLGYDLEKFMRRFRCSIGSITGPEIDSWLRGLGVGPRTRKNLRTSVQTLFNFAKSRRYLPKDHDEMEAVPVAKDNGGEIEIFTVREMMDLLTFARPHEVPFLALGAFAGIPTPRF